MEPVPPSITVEPPLDEASSAGPLIREKAITPIRQAPLGSPHVCECPPARRNLVVCIDGTSNQFSKKNTNVVELYNRLIKDPKTQLTYYSSGIGTYARPSWKSWNYYKQIIGHKVDLAIAWRFEKILLDAYRWISDSYEEGDRIYLFGFSRGAYQVRVLSAMISSIGLIHKGNQNQIPFAYQLYAESEKLKQAARRADAAKEHKSIVVRTKDKLFRRKAEPAGESAPSVAVELDEAEKMLNRFKAAFSRHVQVHFVGAWDTVSSVGIVRDKNLPGTTLGMGHVCYFRHALALHECRVKFLPEYACGGLGPAPEYTVPPTARSERIQQANQPPKGSTARAEPPEKPERVEKARPTLQDAETRIIDAIKPALRPMESNAGLAPVHTKEVWFAGSHSQIGGGVDDNLDLDKFGPALRWISFEAELVGLQLSGDPNDWDTGEVHVYKSLRGFWHVMEFIPFKRLRYGVEGDRTTFRIHLGKTRKIQAGQLIHETALRYTSNKEIDDAASNSVPTDVLNIKKYSPWCARLPPELSWNHISLRNAGVVEEDPYTAAQSILQNIRGEQGLLPESEIIALRALLRTGPGRRSLRDSRNADEILFAVIDIYSTEAVRSRENWPTLVAGATVVLQALRAIGQDTDVDKRRSPDSVILQALRSDMDVDKRRSPDSVRHLAAAIAIHNESMAKLFMLTIATPRVAKPLRVHEESSEWFVSMAYFPPGGPFSGSLVVCGDEGTVRIWNPENGLLRTWKAHPSGIQAVAVSQGTHRIITASRDATLRCWDVTSGEPSSEPMTGHVDWIRSVSLSPSSEYSNLAVSGSDDLTVRLWDTSTALQIGQPLDGHTDYIRCVAFSPDGRYIVSASDDRTIRVWMVDDPTSVQLVGVWHEHEDYVMSVAFSPDGRYIASASRDSTVRLWQPIPSHEASWPYEAESKFVLRGHIDSVNSVSFSPDSTRLVSGSDDQSIIIWSVATGEITWGPFRGHSHNITAVAFSPDGKHIASCALDRTARIWDATDKWWSFQVPPK